jgi:hypothetical protein
MARARFALAGGRWAEPNQEPRALPQLRPEASEALSWEDSRGVAWPAAAAARGEAGQPTSSSAGQGGSDAGCDPCDLRAPALSCQRDRAGRYLGSPSYACEPGQARSLDGEQQAQTLASRQHMAGAAFCL